MMSKPYSSGPSYPPPYQKQVPFKAPVVRIYDPIRKQNIEATEQLFSAVMTGDRDTIMRAISDRDVNYGVFNESNQTLIHTVLENRTDNLKEEHKYEIVNFLLDRNVPAGVQDKYGVTALHLAAKYQYPKITKLLLDKGARINAQDNTNMVPLHYAIKGNLELCKKVKKVGAIIPHSRIKSVNRKDLAKVTEDLIAVIRDPYFSPYMQHIKNTLRKVGDIYAFEFEDEKTRYIADITQIATTYTSLNERNNLLNRKAVAFADTLNGIVTGNLKKPLEAMDIGPDFPVESATVLNRRVQASFVDEQKNAILELDTKIGAIGGIVKTLNSAADNMYDQIYIMSQTNWAAYLSRVVGPPLAHGLAVDDDELESDILYNNPPRQFEFYEINTVGPVPPVTLSDFDTQESLPPANTPLEVAHWRRFLPPNKSSPIRNLGTPPLQRRRLIGNDARYPIVRGLTGMMHVYKPGIPFSGLPVYYLSRHVFAVRNIDSHLTAIQKNIEALQNHVTAQYYYEVYHRILTNILLSCYNIFQNIIIIEEDTEYIRKTTARIKNRFQTLKNKNPSDRNIGLLERCIESLGFLSKSYEESLVDMVKLYDTCYALLESVNKFIFIVNKRAGLQYQARILGTVFNGNNPIPYNNIYSNTLRPFKLPPKTWPDYYKTFGIYTLAEMRTRFYREYAAQLYIGDNLDYIHMPPPPPPAIAIADIYLSSKAVIPDSNQAPPIARSGPAVVSPVPVVFRGGIIPMVQSDPNGILLPPSGVLPLLGRIGVTNNQLPKSTGAIPSIKTVLNDYLYVVKLHFIETLMAFFTRPPPPAPSPTLTNQITRIQNNIIVKLGQVPQIQNQIDLIMRTTVGKIVDELLTAYIRREIYDGVTRYVLQPIPLPPPLAGAPIPPPPPPLSATLFKIDTGFEVNFATLYKDITNAIQPVNKKALMYTVDVMEDQDPLPTQFKKYNSNYLLTSKIVEEQCYKIDPEVIRLLSNSKTVNHRDLDGKSPIFYALDTLHQDAIQILLDKNTFVQLEPSKNNGGITPYKYFVDIYSAHIGALLASGSSVKDAIDKFTKPIYEGIKDNLQSNEKWKNNIIKYLDIVFPQLVLMFNNMFYYYAKSFVNGWTFEDQQAVETLFDSSYKDIDLPVLHNIDKNVMKSSINIRPVVKQVETDGANILKINDQITDIRRVQANLQKERAGLSSVLPLTQIANAQIAEIDAKIRRLDNQVSNITATATTTGNRTNIAQNQTDRDVDAQYNPLKVRTNNFHISKAFLGAPAGFDQIYHHVSRIYNNVFQNVIKSKAQRAHPYGYEDYMLYNGLWKSAINSDRVKHITTLHIMSMLQQKKSLENNNFADLPLLKKLSDTIFVPLIQDMFDLPQYCTKSENYVLTQVFEIMVHIVKHVLCSNLYYAIVKIMVRYLSSLSPAELATGDRKRTGTRDVIAIMDNIITQTPELHKYILGPMATELVKFHTGIYEDDLDEHKDIKSTGDLFKKIETIILGNTVFNIQKSSTLVTDLNTYVFEYYKDLFGQVIPTMKIVIDNYSRYILNESRLLNIMIIMNNHVITKSL